MLSELPAFQVPRGPVAHFGPGALSRLPGAVRKTGADAVLVVTDAVLAATPVIPAVTGTLAAAGIPARVFGGVHPNPTTDDIAAGAAAARELGAAAVTVTSSASSSSSSPPPFVSSWAFTSPASASSAGSASAVASAACVSSVSVTTIVSGGAGAVRRVALVAAGGGSAIDAAKGIALAAVNPQRGRDLDYRNDFAAPALPIVAIPTTAGTGAETNAFGVVTDPATRRKFYVGHASALPAAAILDPSLTMGLPPAVTAATGMDALTHAIESCLSARPNPYSDGLAFQVIDMAARHLPAACGDGGNLEARSQMLFASHIAGLAMAGTGLGIVHAIGHSLGGRWNIAHGAALAMVLPEALRFSLPVRVGRLADIAFALGTGSTAGSAARNAEAAIESVADLRARLGLTSRLPDYGITEADYPRIAADALDDEVLASTPRQPTAADITAILAASAA